MTVLTGETLPDVGIDAVALKPAETNLDRATALTVSTATIDYEGRAHFPDPETLERLACEFEVRVTVPVRADGFDPLGDESLRASIPDSVSEALVAGHPAYLTDEEERRAVAPRLEAAVQKTGDPWVGTEGIERLALAVGGTQFELLSATTSRDVRSLRAAGFDGEIAVYAPTVLTDQTDAVLDAVGDYAARRQRVREKLPAGCPTDSEISGEARETLLTACREYALFGSAATIADRVTDLQKAGVDYVVSYPAGGIEAFLG